MKKKVIIGIFLVILITLICCMIFIKPKLFDFKVTEEYEYIQNNKKDIEEIIVRNNSHMGESCYKLDVENGYDFFNNMDIEKETELWCSGTQLYLEFYFKDGIYKEIHFECENLVYDGIKYKLKDKVILVNKDEYIPDKITKGMIIVLNKDRVDCN